MSLQELTTSIASITLDEAGSEGLSYQAYLARMKAVMLGEDVARRALADLQYHVDSDGIIRRNSHLATAG